MAKQAKKVQKKRPASPRKAVARKAYGKRSASVKRAPAGNASATKSKASPYVRCSVPDLPERRFEPNVGIERASLIRSSDTKWVNGTELHYYFYTDLLRAGSASHRQVVKRAFARWLRVGIGLKFIEVKSPADAEIRIAFRRGDGHWSYVGRDVLKASPAENTLNLDPSDGESLDTAIHEIGHTLGFSHEHQNPNAGIEWDEEAVYAQLARPPNRWSREKTFHNIIKKLDPELYRGSRWDRDSIMHYPFEAGLIRKPKGFESTPLVPAPGLSTNDKRWVKQFYPPLRSRDPLLRPFDFHRLELKPRGQANWRIEPTSSRKYTMRTFGQSDSVLVLFEQVGNEWRYMTGNDDSGTALNAKIRTRLQAERNYKLRARLYSVHQEGEFGLLMW